MKTEVYNIENDIKVMFVQATELEPEAFQEAFNQLEVKLSGKATGQKQAWRSFLEGYQVYGKTGMEDGKVVYRACAKENVEGESKDAGLPLDIIEAGAYNSLILENWTEKMPQISTIFGEMLALPETKPSSICLEYYKDNNEMVLLVKRKD